MFGSFAHVHLHDVFLVTRWYSICCWFSGSFVIVVVSMACVCDRGTVMHDALQQHVVCSHIVVHVSAL